MSNPPKVGLAEALKQRELDDEDRDSSTEADDWGTGPDSPTKKPAVPQRKLTRPGERAPQPVPARPAVTKPQPTGSSPAEKRPHSEVDASDSSARGKRACDAYEVNLAATEYGMCKCGFKKNEHVQSAAYRAAPRALGAVYHPEVKVPEKKPISLVDTSSPMHPSAETQEDESTESKAVPCDAFEVDLQAKEFGTCKCGFKKAQHSKSAQLAAPRRPSATAFPTVQLAEKQAQEERQREQEEAQRKATQEARAHQEFLEKERKIREMEGSQEAVAQDPSTATGNQDSEPTNEGPKACDSYEIDLNAAEFGTCKCGFKKTEHSKSALFNKPLPQKTHVSSLNVPSVPKVTSNPSTNRAPPAFATAAPAASKVQPNQESEPNLETANDEPAPQEAHHEDSTSESREGGEKSLGDDAGDVHDTVDQGTILDPPHPYKALYDFDGVEVEDLSFKTGEIIEVLEILDEEWMRGRIGDRTGVFPSNYVSKLDDAADEATPSEEERPPETEVASEEHPKESTIVDEARAEQPAIDESATAQEGTTGDVTEADVEDRPEQSTVQTEMASVEHAEPVIAETLPSEEPFAEEAPIEEAPIEEAPMEEAVPEEVIPEETIPVEDEAAVVAVEEKEVPFTVYALFDFPGESEDDLPFARGDTIEVIAIVDADWWKGTLSGREGIFPANFVSRDPEAVSDSVAVQHETASEVTGASGVLGTVTAQFDMEPQNEGDLGFKTGDIIEILAILDDDWYRGSLHGEEGLVPRNYVSELST